MYGHHMASSRQTNLQKAGSWPRQEVAGPFLFAHHPSEGGGCLFRPLFLTLALAFTKLSHVWPPYG